MVLPDPSTLSHTCQRHLVFWHFGLCISAVWILHVPRHRNRINTCAALWQLLCRNSEVKTPFLKTDNVYITNGHDNTIAWLCGLSMVVIASQSRCFWINSGFVGIRCLVICIGPLSGEALKPSRACRQPTVFRPCIDVYAFWGRWRWVPFVFVSMQK